MSAITTPATAATSANSHAFWERLWRMSGIQFVVLFVIVYIEAAGILSPETLDRLLPGEVVRV